MGLPRAAVFALLLAREAEATWFEPGSPCHERRGAGKRVLVTGITGMLGSHIAEALLEQEYEVYGWVRPRGNVRNIASFANRVKLVYGELTDPFRTMTVMRDLKPDYVFHFAAQAFNSLSFGDPDYTLNTNIRTTLNLLEAARHLELQNTTKFLVAGSSTVYGSTTDEWDGPIPERAPMQPVSPYGVSKAATELLVLQYTRTHGIHAVVPRFFIHLAPRGVEALALHEFARQIAMIEHGAQEPVIQHGDIATKRDITDIVDSAPVVVCVAATAPSGTVVNIGSNISYTIREILEGAVQRSSMASKIQLKLDTSRLRAYDERTVLADITFLKNLTGWIPQPNMGKLTSQLLNYWRREVKSRLDSKDEVHGKHSGGVEL